MIDVIFEHPGRSAHEDDMPLLDQWLVRDGDMVTEGQLIALVAIAKTSIEVVAPTAGRIQLLVEAQEMVDPSQPIARIVAG